jgi:hypothetical protein
VTLGGVEREVGVGSGAYGVADDLTADWVDGRSPGS